MRDRSCFEHLDDGWLRSKPGVKWATTPAAEIPAWIADMDFPPPAPVVEAMVDELRFGDLGYPDVASDRLERPFVDWMERRHGVALRRGRVREFNDVVNAAQAIFSLHLEPGDGVAFHTPTYPPFLATFEAMDLRPEPIPLSRSGDRWHHDPDRAAEAIGRSRALLIVNPHNPTGRVFDPSELATMLEAARRSRCLVVSDEVHADLVYAGHRHVPAASLDPEVCTLFSASKTFNLAGIRCAVAHVGPDATWERLNAAPQRLFGSVANLSATATRVAWQEGVPWLDDVTRVLADNRRSVVEGAPEGVGVIPPEGTFLAWMDFTRTGLREAPGERLRAMGVRLSDGAAFGEGGRGFARLNFATTPEVLAELLARVDAAVAGTGGAGR